MRWSFALTVLVACGGGGGGPDALDGPDAGPPLGPNTVHVSLSNVDYIRYSDGDGPWRTPQELTPGEFELRVTDDYRLVYVCTDGAIFEAHESAYTFNDGDPFEFCGAGYPVPPTAVAITGTMQQPGTVFMDGLESSDTAPWNFSLDVEPGPHELIAVTADRILVRRDQQITTAMSVPTVDVVQDGVALDVIPLTVNGTLVDDVVDPHLDFFTTNDLAFIYGTPTDILAPPASIVMGTDFQFLFISADSPTTRRSVSAIFTGTQTTFTLPDVLNGATYTEADGVLTGAWGFVPDIRYGTMYVDDGVSIQIVRASAAWLSAKGVNGVGFDAVTASDYDPAWVIDRTGPYTREVSVSGVGGSSGLIEHVNGATARRPTRELWRESAKFRR
jgi:hypothetical protein